MGIGSAAAAILVPKCPACLALCGWALSALGLQATAWDRLEWPVTVALLAFALALLNAKAARIWPLGTTTLALAAKMSIEGRFSWLMLGGWICIAIPLSALAYQRTMNTGCGSAKT
jgi:hypothetical protein